jgi:PHD/YefM family antitoxin component YafN of YafNO toxin-antitoxin module
LLIIIGTSLQVQPFASLIDDVPEHVPRLLINKELAGVHKSRESGFDFKWKNGLHRDVAYLGDCEEGIVEFARLLGWEKDLERMYTKGHEKLKAIWKAEQEAIEANNKEEEVIIDQKQDKEVDQLAETLEKLTASEEQVVGLKKEEEKKKPVTRSTTKNNTNTII